MRHSILVILGALVFAACSGSDPAAAPSGAPAYSAASGVENPASGIRVPDGFKATVFADKLGGTRHLAVRADGTVYAALRNTVDGKGTVALRDTDGDGKADETIYFGEIPGTGIAMHDGYLYRSSETEIVRYPMAADEPAPTAEPEVIVSGFPAQSQHATKPMTFDGAGKLYVTIGAPSNACQKSTRTPGSPGLHPCPQLELQAGIWRFDANKPGQVHGRNGERYSTGIRNGLSIDWNTAAGALYFANHGRDSLHTLFPEFYSEAVSAELPSEEFHRADKGSDYGWPYTYWDQSKNARMSAPEYGGDGKKTADTNEYRAPLVAFPGHWAPNDLVFYAGTTFPDYFHNGAFIAWHGSWNRAPLPQAGYQVTFVPMNAAGEVTGEWVTFADKFKGEDTLMSPGDAEFRPTGLAVGPDGALFIAEDQTGRIWKVSYQGQ